MNFELIKEDKQSKARLGKITTEHGIIKTPIFMPVGTSGTVKGIHQHELKEDTLAQIILGNTYHLYLRPGLETIKGAGGLHKFIKWEKPLLTDSGGYQVYSLSGKRKIQEEGVKFQSHIDGSYHFFTPEYAIDVQRIIGADIIMAFDECPPGQADEKVVRSAVDRTTKWIKQCSDFIKQNSPLYDWEQTLFPIIQGGAFPSLREKSTEELLPYSKCGIAIGGLAVGEKKSLMFETINLMNTLLPKDQPRYLMGVGRPTDIVRSVQLGIDTVSYTHLTLPTKRIV